MKTIIITMVIAIGFAACTSVTNKKAPQSSSTMTAKVMYTCPMHHEVTSDKPGQCPKCGMDLVKKEMTPDQMKDMNMDSTKH